MAILVNGVGSLGAGSSEPIFVSGVPAPLVPAVNGDAYGRVTPEGRALQLVQGTPNASVTIGAPRSPQPPGDSGATPEQAVAILAADSSSAAARAAASKHLADLARSGRGAEVQAEIEQSIGDLVRAGNAEAAARLVGKLHGELPGLQKGVTVTSLAGHRVMKAVNEDATGRTRRELATYALARVMTRRPEEGGLSDDGFMQLYKAVAETHPRGRTPRETYYRVFSSMPHASFTRLQERADALAVDFNPFRGQFRFGPRDISLNRDDVHVAHEYGDNRHYRLPEPRS